VIEKSQEACLKSNHRIEDHFDQILAMVGIGSDAQREVEDWALSRYFCSPRDLRAT
jgi:DNA-damage-inducible protein D